MTDEETIQALETKLDVMWDKIQDLKEKDLFAAQCMYEKYKVIACELPPPLPSNTTDQAASQQPNLATTDDKMPVV